MKILFTGSTAKQVDDDAYKRARVNRIDDSSIICNSLRKQGHIVERREVKWDDDLSEYDIAIVGLAPFGSTNSSRFIMNALYAISSVDKVLIFYEDWKIKNLIDTFKRMNNTDIFEKALNRKWSNGDNFYRGIDNPNFNKEKAMEIINNVINGKYDAMIPAFDWGDKEIIRNIIKSKNIYNIDYTPYVLKEYNIPMNLQINKDKKYMLASLVNHSKWVKNNKLKWNVDYYGCKSLKAPMLKDELDVFNTSGKYWGILSPEYPHAGSGWFRIRWIYAALHESIIIASDKDFKALNIKKVNIEELTDEELKSYAKKLSNKILSFMWSIEDFDNKINEIVKTVNEK